MHHKKNGIIVFLCITALAIFAIVVATSDNNALKSDTTENTNNIVPIVDTDTKNAGSYTFSQVAVHKTASDCWIIIGGKVYGVSPFISNHPGGKSAITSRCGTDATAVFNGSGSHKHSNYAISLLPTYLVGDLAK